MILPTPRLAAFAIVAALVASAAAVSPTAASAAYVLDLAIALAAVVDALFLLGPKLEISREAAPIFSTGRPNAVVISVRSRRRSKLTLLVDDDPVAETERRGVPEALEVSAGGTATLRYELVPTRRGARELGAVTVRHRGPLGLIARQERASLPQRIDVYPDVHAARVLELLRRAGRQDARLGSLRVRGGDTDFERLRSYVPGDEVRHIDWRATARRDDVTVRQYQAESNQNVVFALDVGRSMRGESDGIGHVDLALNAALLAADVALRGGDKAAFLAFDDQPRAFLPPTGGRAGARKLTRLVHALEAGLAATDYRVGLGFLQTTIRARSLIIVFTQLLEPRSSRDLVSSLRSLLPRHLPLCVLLRDTALERLAIAPASGLDDLYVRAAAAEALAGRDALVRELRNAGVLVLDARPEDVTPHLVQRYLDIKARRLL
jgi:uncharacterized protein (DUF58 family)